MKKVTIKEYAVKHKLSMFNVMKMVRTGKLMVEEKEEDGKKSILILLDEQIGKEVRDNIVPMEVGEEKTLKEEMTALQDEIRLLRYEIEEMKKRL